MGGLKPAPTPAFMSVSDTELSALADTHDIIALGVAADEVRRRLHGTVTRFVRGAAVVPAPGAAFVVPRAAGEVRTPGGPTSRGAAVARVREVVAAAGGTPLSGFSLADLEALALRDHVTLRSLLEELQAAGLELLAEATFEQLRDTRRAVQEDNIE